MKLNREKNLDVTTFTMTMVTTGIMTIPSTKGINDVIQRVSLSSTDVNRICR
jgi:hypothetical protein